MKWWRPGGIVAYSYSRNIGSSVLPIHGYEGSGHGLSCACVVLVGACIGSDWQQLTPQ